MVYISLQWNKSLLISYHVMSDRHINPVCVLENSRGPFNSVMHEHLGSSWNNWRGWKQTMKSCGQMFTMRWIDLTVLHGSEEGLVSSGNCCDMSRGAEELSRCKPDTIPDFFFLNCHAGTKLPSVTHTHKLPRRPEWAWLLTLINWQL